MPTLTERNLMGQAETQRKAIIKVIEKGEEGAELTMPLNVGAVVFRVSINTLQKLRESQLKLGISVENDNLKIQLTGEKIRRETYIFFYGLLQAIQQEAGLKFLEQVKIPESLKKVPEINDAIEVIKKNKCVLPDEDKLSLQIYLLASWLSLRDKSGLHPPEIVYSSLG